MKSFFEKLKNGVFCVLCIAFITSCNKSSQSVQQPKIASLDFSKLINNQWLTLKYDTSYCCRIRYQILCRDQIIITDSTKLIFQSDSSWIRSITTKDVTNYSTIPYTGYPDCSYFPHGNSFGTGNFSFNALDSSITITSGLLNFVKYEVLLLNDDSLKLSDPTEGITTYVSH